MIEGLPRSSIETTRLAIGRRVWPRRLHERLNQSLQPLNFADRLTLAYLLCTSVLVMTCQHNIPQAPKLLFIHCGLIAGILLLAVRRNHGPRMIHVLSHWYPLLLPGFFFEEIGHLVHAIFPGWFDHALIAADHALFGAHPTVWLEQFSSYWLTEYLQLVYTTYLLLIPAFGAYLWWRRKRDQFAAFTAALCVTYYLNYLIFVFFPIEGPQHTLAQLQQGELTGGPFTAFISLIEKHGRVHGGAFPSNHVAGSMVVLFSAFRCSRRLSYVLTPLVLSICVATVYGRYHYALDVFAGTLMAGFGCWLIRAREKKKAGTPEECGRL